MRKIASGLVRALFLTGFMALTSPTTAAADHRDQGGWGDWGRDRAAPGPIAAAGLPFLAIGYGVYWLTKRRRRPD
jgi:hypothetical protein